MGQQARIAGALLIALPVAAQELRILSEFERPDPFGGIAVPDRGPQPREIISPAVVRNAWGSFHLAVTLPAAGESWLYLQQNPEVFQIKLYREQFTKTSAGWVPDGLQPAATPCAVVRDPAIAGQTTVAYWMDIWVPPNVPVRRVRVEALLRTADLWTVYPMEVRVLAPVAPSIFHWGGALPRPESRADTAAVKVVCGNGPSDGRPMDRVPALIRRNVMADVSLARARKVQVPCDSTPGPPEWYLRVRDRIYRTPEPVSPKTAQ